MQVIRNGFAILLPPPQVGSTFATQERNYLPSGDTVMVNSMPNYETVGLYLTRLGSSHSTHLSEEEALKVAASLIEAVAKAREGRAAQAAAEGIRTLVEPQ